MPARVVRLFREAEAEVVANERWYGQRSPFAASALNAAAAASMGAAELVTTEKPSRLIHRARSVRIATIHPEAA